MNVAVLLYDQVELLDFAGPIEVFTTANRVDGSTPFEVFTVNEFGGATQSRAGLECQADYSIENAPPSDLLIVPGGDVSTVIKNTAVLSWIQQQAQTAAITASVCTGALLLAECGLLKGKDATTHWEDIPLLQQYPDVNVLQNQRWVDNGHIITSGGIAAGIDMSLYLVQRLASQSLAIATAKQMEYPFSTNNL